MGGIHRSWLAASKAHRHFVNEVRRCSKSGPADPPGLPFTSGSWSQATRSPSIVCLRGRFRLQGESPVLGVRI
jgi:hypothetical protein